MNETERAEYMAIVAAFASSPESWNVGGSEIAACAMALWKTSRDEWYRHEDADSAVGKACKP